MTTYNTPTVQVLVNGRPVKTYQHEGKTYIEGKNGTQYTIRIQNNANTRICAIVSVDGLDVVTGKPANEQARGYIIEQFRHTDIKGFRISDNDVGAFKFSSKDNSYAKTKGKKAAQNVGVIGVIAFTEKAKPVPPHLVDVYHHDNYYDRPYRRLPWMPAPVWYSSDCDSYSGVTCSSNYCAIVSNGLPLGHQTRNNSLSNSQSLSNAQVFDMGTTWGDKINDRAISVEFDRGYKLPLVEMYYASRSALITMGVELHPTVRVEKMPQSFDDQYAQPPAGW